MEPLNSFGHGCSPVSSECIIWQGKDLPCIGLCNGDTISDVVYKVAVDLCEIMNQLDISNYDLSCFGLGHCGPEDYKNLIQLLVDKVCALERRKGDEGASLQEGIETEVEVAEIFYGKDSAGDVIKRMPIKDYVDKIGRLINNRVQTIISSIEKRLNDVDERIEYLEQNENNEQSDSISVNSCLLGESYPISYVVENLDCDYSKEKKVIGDPESITYFISRNNLSSLNSLLDKKSYGNNENWVKTVSTLNESLNNAWLIIEDLHSTLSAYIAANPLKPKILIKSVAAQNNQATSSMELLLIFSTIALNKSSLKKVQLRLCNSENFDSNYTNIIPISPQNIDSYTDTPFTIYQNELDKVKIEASKYIYIRLEADVNPGYDSVEGDYKVYTVANVFGQMSFNLADQTRYDQIIVKLVNQPIIGTMELWTNTEISEFYRSKDVNGQQGEQNIVFEVDSMDEYKCKIKVDGIYSNEITVRSKKYNEHIALLSSESDFQDLIEDTDLEITKDKLKDYIDTNI